MVRKFYLGAHMSIAMGYKNSLISSQAIGGTGAQIFLKNPRGRFGKLLDESEARETKEYLKKNDLFLIGHCSYLLNFAKPFKENPWAVESLIDDLTRISKLGGVGVVLHIGKYLDYSKQEAFSNIRDNIKIVLDKTPKDVYVIWENTAGQGTEIGFRFEELAELYQALGKHERIKFCLDTCHSHSAGYDLSTKEGVLNWKAEFDKNIGWENVVCIHFNDDKKEAASRVDRHADLGYGTIGIDGLKEIAKLAKKDNIPLMLETPSDNIDYRYQIDMIKNWI